MVNLRLWTSYEVVVKKTFDLKFAVKDLLQIQEVPTGASPNLMMNLRLKLCISPSGLAGNMRLLLRPSRGTTAPNELENANEIPDYLSRFFADMNVKGGRADSVVEILPAYGECFDAGWLLPQSGDPSRPFALFLECNCRDIDTSAVLQSNPETLWEYGHADLPAKGKQAKYLGNIISMAKRDVEAGTIIINSGSLLEALLKDRYPYVYLDASERLASQSIGDNVLWLRRGDASRFLSFFDDFYRLLNKEVQ